MSNKLYVNFVLFWPYFGYYSSSYYQFSIVALVFFLFLISEENYQAYAMIAGIMSTIMFSFGQLMHGIDLSSIREILRLTIWVLAFGIGYKYNVRLPFVYSLLIMGMIIFVSKYYHPSLPWLSSIWAVAPEFNDSYHYFRTITFGGMPATTAYVFVFMSVFGTLMYRRKQITGYSLIFGYLLVGILTFTTLSRLALIFLLMVNVLLLSLSRKDLLKVVAIFVLAILILYFFVNQDKIPIPERWYSIFTAIHRLETIPYVFNVLNEDALRLFPGCLFNRDCHFDGTIRSISTDGGLLYLMLNWGFPIISFAVLTFLSIACFYFSRGRYEFGIILILGLLFSLFDPLITDPKVSFLWFFTLGFTFAKANCATVTKNGVNLDYT